MLLVLCINNQPLLLTLLTYSTDQVRQKRCLLYFSLDGINVTKNRQIVTKSRQIVTKLRL